MQAETDRRPTTSWVAGTKMGCPYDWVNGKHQGNTTKATSKNAIYKKKNQNLRLCQARELGSRFSSHGVKTINRKKKSIHKLV